MRPHLLALAALATVAIPAHSAEPGQPAKVAQSYGNLPLSFEANQGQTAPEVKFTSRGNGYSLFLTEKGAVLSLTKSPPSGASPSNKSCHPERSEGPASLASRTLRPPENCATKTDTIQMQFSGANRNAQPQGTDQLPGTANYFLGNDPAKWRTNVPTYAKVRYNSVYPGIDLVYYGNQRQLEYDFIVAPNANTNPIRLQFKGAISLNLTPQGDLTVQAANGRVVLHKPEIYQEIDGRHQSVRGRFAMLENHSVGFALGTYNHAAPLVIDPVLVYSTYLGPTNQSHPPAIAVDTSGNAYIAGTGTAAQKSASAGSSQQEIPPSGSNLFITKLNATGTALLYSVSLGGNGSGPNGTPGDILTSIALDSSGDAYVTGYTNSTNFPVTAGAFQTTNRARAGLWNAFIARINPTGTGLIYSTYLGGSGGPGNFADGQGGDQAFGIAVDDSDNAYVTGATPSPDFPVTSGAFQPLLLTKATFNSFVTKLDPNGTSLVYSTYLGGSGNRYESDLGDEATAIALDSERNAYLTGWTTSADFPVTPGAYQAITPNSYPAGFVSKLNKTGSSLLYSTYFGGEDYSGAPYPNAIALDAADDAYIAGWVDGMGIPVTKGAFQSTNQASAFGGNVAAFAAKLNPTGTAPIYSTYLSGSEGDYGYRLALDSAGDAYIVGEASSADFPVTEGAFLTAIPTAGNLSVTGFVTRLNAAGTALLYSTFLGGSYEDEASSVALDNSGNAYVTGWSASTDFPVTKGAFLTTNPGGTPGFATKLDVNVLNTTTPTTTKLTASANPLIGGQTVTFTAKVTRNDTGASVPGYVIFTVDGSVYSNLNWQYPNEAVETLSAGTAVWFTSAIPLGKHTIEAVYHGSSEVGMSKATLNENVIPVATPVFSPTGGTFTSPQNVAITDATKGAILFYTRDGSTPSQSSTQYKSPIPVGATETLQAIALVQGSQGNISSDVAKAEFTILKPAAKPVFSPGSGILTSPHQIAISDATAGATIYYTTNGKPPTTTSTKYTAPIVVSGTETIQAIAVAAGYATSEVATGVYKFPPLTATPTFSVKQGTYDSTQTVKILDETTGAQIHYSTNGGTPTINGRLYTVPITIAATSTLKAVAIAPGFSVSEVGSATYTITPPAPAPTFYPAAGAYKSAQTVKLADKATAGLEIYYTTNGQTPTASSTKYTSAGIKVSSTETIKAIAVAKGDSPSPVASATYTIK